ELAAALVAEARPQMILATALAATVGQFAAGHGHERALGALDDLEITDNEGVVERHRAEGLQALVLVAIFHELDTDFGDNHSCAPFFCGTLNRNSEQGTVSSPPEQGGRRRSLAPVPGTVRGRGATPRRGHDTGRTHCCRCRSSTDRQGPVPATGLAPGRPRAPAARPAP